MRNLVTARIRAGLLASVALTAAQPAFATEDATSEVDRDSLISTAIEAQSAASTINLAEVVREPHYRDFVKTVTPEPEILIANPQTPTTARDPVNITGIAQMVVDNGGGGVGLCTGTLINPRTVIFAAHCVNSRAATAYGANSGGTGIAFGFETNTRANAAGQTDELVRWLLGTGVGTTARFQTNVAQAFYNVNHVAYNPLSLEPAARSFLYGDVAIATLDTPAANIPTWALLFSPLSAPTTSTAAGTGYNVSIVGYGGNGTGTSGTQPIDFRRRAAENVIGALTDLSTFESFLFGSPAQPSLRQNLYFIDFDDPRRGMATASIFDFNAFRDNARVSNGTPTEGITAGGDSGGPLILQGFARQVVAGVLSGGYTRFFTAQPANGFGTVSFYQPLYLYWDWIAANNPYHYVTNVAGSRNWTDGANWVTTLDPNYMVLSGNTLVNGIPTVTGEQNTGTTGDFGEICFESGGVAECLNTRTGTETVTVRPIGTADNAPAEDTVAATDNAATTTLTAGVFDGIQLEAQAAAVAIPAPTLTNGLPGATGFTPNNVDPVRTTGAAGRYFDVTLAAAGTTTLNTAVTIDRLTVATNVAQLNVATGGSLTSLMGINQLAGFVTVDGTINSVGDYSLFGGGILGTGRINAPFLTSVLGQISPGTTSTVGTLTIGGNLILASGNTYFVNLAGSGASDRIAVVANGTSTGAANVGGLLNVSLTSAVRGNTSYTILTAAGGVTGSFITPAAFSAILRPTLSYSANAVVLNVVAGSYTGVVSSSNSVAFAYAQLLDANRGNAGNYDGFYGPLDLQNAATIVSTLNSLTPATESTVQTLGIASVDANSGFIRNRLSGLDPADLGGTVAHYGSPVQVAALGLSPFGGSRIASDMAAPTMLQEGALPETMSGFVTGGYINGDGRAMTGVGGKDKFDGWYVGGGLEVAVGEGSLVGFAVSYSDLDGTPSFGGQSVKNEAFQGTLYGKSVSASGLIMDGQFTAGAVNARSTRAINFLGTPYTLRASDSALVMSAEFNVGQDFGGDSFEITPRVGARAAQIGFGSALESGGPMALDIERPKYQSIQGRGGLTLAGKSPTLRPFVTGTYVHEFKNQPNFVQANLVGGAGNGVLFALNGQDKDWGELSGGLTFKTGAVDLSIAADTTIERSDISVQTYRGSITFRF